MPVTLGLALIRGQCDFKPYYAPADFLAHSLPGGGFSTTARIAASCVPWTCPDQKPQQPGAAQPCNDMLDTFDQKTTFTL